MSQSQPAETPDKQRSKYHKKPDLIPGLKIVIDALFGVIFYVFGDDLTNWGWVRIGWFFHYLVFCSGLYLLANLRFRKTLRRMTVFIQLGIACSAVFGLYCWLSGGPKVELKLASPQVLPSRISLASSSSPTRNAVTVFNPNDFPLFDVVIRVSIEQIGVPASSLVIDAGKPPLAETNFGDISVDFMRSDLNPVMPSQPTNKFPQLVYLKFGFIPARQNREFRISGSLKTNSWATLSVLDYNKTLSIHNWRSNFTVFNMLTPSLKDAPKGFSFSLANIPFGAVLYNNDLAVFTNLPHLHLALDTSDVGGAKQFNLTNNFIFSVNDQVSFPLTNGLLEIPSYATVPTLKLWLVNDSAVEVTNIDVVFTSMAGCAFRTNEFWRENPAVTKGVTNPLIFHLDSLPIDRSVMISPISCGDLISGGPPGLIGVCMTATNMPMQLSSLWIAFVPTNVLSKPKLLKVVSSAAVSNDSVAFSMQSFPTPEPQAKKPDGQNWSNVEEQNVLIVVFSIVAILIISVVIYAIRADG